MREPEQQQQRPFRIRRGRLRLQVLVYPTSRYAENSTELNLFSTYGHVRENGRGQRLPHGRAPTRPYRRTAFDRTRLKLRIREPREFLSHFDERVTNGERQIEFRVNTRIHLVTYYVTNPLG